MKINIEIRGDEKSREISNFIKEELNINTVHSKPDYVFAIGGDGTTLRAIQKYIDIIDNVVIIPINTGSLGFLTNFTSDPEDIRTAINLVKSGTNEFYEHKLLEVQCNNKTTCALNEVTLIDAPDVQVLDIYVDNKLLETFRGSGICISTSIGSTAYNKSLHGAVTDNSIEILQLTEIASINSNAYRTLNSPIIFDGTKTIRITSNQPKKTVTYDHLHLYVSDFNEMTIRLSKRKVKLLKKDNDYMFVDRIKRAFL